jgi:hypothetical protein
MNPCIVVAKPSGARATTKAYVGVLLAATAVCGTLAVATTSGDGHRESAMHNRTVAVAYSTALTPDRWMW